MARESPTPCWMSQEGGGEALGGTPLRFLPGWWLYNVKPVTTVQSWPSGLQVHCAPGPAMPSPGRHSSTSVLAAPALVWLPPSSSGATKAVSSLPAPATCLGCWFPGRPRGSCPHIPEGSCQHPQPSWHCVACRIKSNLPHPHPHPQYGPLPSGPQEPSLLFSLLGVCPLSPPALKFACGVFLARVQCPTS